MSITARRTALTTAATGSVIAVRLRKNAKRTAENQRTHVETRLVVTGFAKKHVVRILKLATLIVSRSHIKGNLR